MGEPSADQPIARRFVQRDSPVVYSDYVQVARSSEEVLLQFYLTIPGAPAEGGQITEAESRLMATIIMSPAHAARLSRALAKTTEGIVVPTEPPAIRGTTRRVEDE